MLNYDTVNDTLVPLRQYFETLNASDRVRLCGFLFSQIDSFQQEDAIPDHIAGFAYSDLNFDVDDPAGLSYSIHCMLDDLFEQFEDIANAMDKEPEILAKIDAKMEKERKRQEALARLSPEDRDALGL